MPVHKGNDLRVLIFPRQLHALVDGNAVRHIVDIAHFINGKPHRRLRQAEIRCRFQRTAYWAIRASSSSACSQTPVTQVRI